MSNKITNFFGWLEQITYYKKDWDNFDEIEKKHWNSYMIHKSISYHEPYIEIVNLAQKYQFSDRDLYNFYKSIIPKKKVYFNYIKAQSSQKYNQELITILSEYFRLSSREIKDYIPLLSKENITNILQQLGLENKEIKKLLK
jgi:hypothetical protein